MNDDALVKEKTVRALTDRMIAAVNALEFDPSMVGQATDAALSALASAGSAGIARDEAVAARATFTDLGTTDGQSAALINTPASATRGALDPLLSGKVAKGVITLHVADYGALGDGATDDTAAIASAFTAARAAKASLRFGYGKTYIVSGTLNPTGVSIDGFSATIKVKPASTQNYAVFQPSGAWSANDLTFDLNKANTTDPASASTGMAIYTYNASGWTGTVRLQDIRVVNGWQTAIRLGTATAATDPALVAASKAQIVGLSVESCKVGVYLQNTSGVTVQNASITSTTSEGISDYFSYGNQVIGGHIRSAGNHGIVTQYSYGFQVNGVNVSGSGNMGIVVGGGSNTLNHARNFRITGCSVSGSASNGFSVDPTKTGAASVVQPVYAAITGNVSTGNGMHGIYLHNAEAIALSGNVSVGNVAAAAGGLAMDSRGCTVSGNLFSGNSYGIKFQGEVAGYGSHVVSGNTVVDNTTSNYAYSAYGSANTAMVLHGVGIPALGAPVGSTYTRTDGSAGATLYVKESGGLTSSGWVAK